MVPELPGAASRTAERQESARRAGHCGRDGSGGTMDIDTRPRRGSGTLWRRLNTTVGLRGRVGAGVAGAAVALAAGWGLWSCQSTPAPMRASAPQEIPTSEPEVRVRIKTGVASVKLSGPGEFLVRAGVGESREFSGPLTVAATEAGCRITDGAGVVSNVAAVPMVDIEARSKGSLAETPAKIRVDGVPYAGRVRVLM